MSVKVLEKEMAWEEVLEYVRTHPKMRLPTSSMALKIAKERTDAVVRFKGEDKVRPWAVKSDGTFFVMCHLFKEKVYLIQR